MVIARASRTVVFAPRLEQLLAAHTGDSVFRLEPDTIGIADPGTMDGVLRARPANAEERPTFKPVLGRGVTRTESAALMQALGADVRAALKRPADRPDLTGTWPDVPHDYLRRFVFGPELRRFRVLVDRRLELTPKLTWSAVTAGAALVRPPAPGTPLSTLARQVVAAGSLAERRFRMYLYRRVAGPICFTVAALVTSAVWLGAPFDDDVPNEHVIHEALRLLPPSWNILRVRSPEFAAVDPRIRAGDDVLLLPLLSHRSPELWEAPAEFRPRRWAGLDPDTHPGYLPFGHANERCWGRHLVLPLASRLLDVVRAEGLAPDPRRTRARVELDGLLEPSGVRVVRPGSSGRR
ncbi:cytochrome P450 [Amycolatopsis sp. NPDC049159]|uniref:cytochrome P450 n=1 Tax=Amycolatopsis sp. NPDC049159 TaxID=3157210 RepID=UPI0033C239FD